jgi:hypothetical protein
MSAAIDPQTIDTQGFTDYSDYQFLGDSETVTKKRKVLEGVRFKGSLYHAAQYAGCARGSIYRWLESDPEFAEALADATEDRDDRLETSVYERAFTDSLLAMFYLKAHRHKFRDKTVIDINVVQNEINERMQALNLKQLPAMTPQFIEGAIDTSYSQNTEDSQPTQDLAIPAPSLESTKRDE